ncbi:MAG TPA: hypothetical protein IAB72_02160 [Candidatus Onthoplasma faecipullorum]|nr:hypothetical protein [Candidatus Onthoplasma faecipullorum]
MNENSLVHVIENNSSKTTLTARFVSVLERYVGADYYQYLYLAFSSLEELKNKNLLLRQKINENNLLLENYENGVENSRKKIGDIKKTYLKEIESLINIKYDENLKQKVEQIKAKIDVALNDLLDANNALKPSEELEAEIANIKSEIKEIYQDINFAYDGLRSLGRLKIYESQTKQECRADFFNSINEDNAEIKYNLVFEKLYNLAVNEANGLNKIANMAKQITLKYTTGLEEFDKEDIKKIELAINEYDNNFSKLSTVTDQELMNN